MKFNGAFYNPEYDGEGFGVTEYADGTVVLHWFSYAPDGKQLWLFCSGKRVGNEAVLEAEITSGGKMGDKNALKQVQRRIWGRVVLADAGDSLVIQFRPATGGSWQYPAQPLHVAAAGTRLKLETKGPATTSPWQEVEKLWGVVEVPARTITGKKSWGQDRITVLEGTLTITSVTAQGANNPALSGVSRDQVFNKGDSFVVTSYIGPLTKQLSNGQWEMSSFGLFTKELGQIMQTAVNVIY